LCFNRGVAQLASVLAWGASGRPFESDHPDNFKLSVGQLFLSCSMTYFVYILISEKDQSFYIGQTQNIIKRLENHNNGYNKSTKAKIPWKILHTWEVNSRSKAMKLEKKLKAFKKRDVILNFIENNKTYEL